MKKARTIPTGWFCVRCEGRGWYCVNCGSSRCVCPDVSERALCDHQAALINDVCARKACDVIGAIFVHRQLETKYCRSCAFKINKAAGFDLCVRTADL